MRRHPAGRMSEVYSLDQGDAPLVISIPHDGRMLMPGQAEQMTDVGRSIPDTDWHVCRLYEFAAALGATIIAARYSRYVVDLNRPAEDVALYEGQVSTGLCPLQSFAGEALYTPDFALSDEDRLARIRDYWQPYHDRLQAVLDNKREEFGQVVLWDAHSIAGSVPRLFDGVLPDLNIGTNGGSSCHADIQAAVCRVAEAAPFASVVNGRFKGGHITRHYGRPAAGIHALQLELVQRNYMDETSREFDTVRAVKLANSIRQMLDKAVEAANAL
jgi:N-formylglutamate amidohydrolase